MLHDEFRSHTMGVERATRASDGEGGWTATFASVGSVTGSLQPLSAAETVAAEQARAEARWAFYCDPDSGIARDDELTYSDRRFRVLDVLEWAAGSTIDHLRVDLEEIQRGT